MPQSAGKLKLPICQKVREIKIKSPKCQKVRENSNSPYPVATEPYNPLIPIKKNADFGAKIRIP